MRLSSQFASDVCEERETAQAVLDADTEKYMDKAQWLEHIADLQTAHSLYMTGMVYRRGIMEQTGTTVHRQYIFRLSSTDWYRFLEFASADNSPETSSNLYKHKQIPWKKETDDSQIIQRYCLNTIDITQTLRQITGQETIQFRGVQATVLQIIQDGESPVLAVIQTDRKKNILFILPVFAEPGETIIIVVPLLSLRGDIIQQYQILDISCVLWESCQPPDKATIVLVIPESAVTENFYIFINRLKQTRQLDRIIIDEYYIILNNQQNF